MGNQQVGGGPKLVSPSVVILVRSKTLEALCSPRVYAPSPRLRARRRLSGPLPTATPASKTPQPFGPGLLRRPGLASLTTLPPTTSPYVRSPRKPKRPQRTLFQRLLARIAAAPNTRTHVLPFNVLKITLAMLDDMTLRLFDQGRPTLYRLRPDLCRLHEPACWWHVEFNVSKIYNNVVTTSRCRQGSPRA